MSRIPIAFVASLLATLALACGVPTSAPAHEYWLAPSSYRAATSDTVTIAAFAGTGFRGERKPYATPRAVRFSMRAARPLDLKPLARNGDLDWARVILPDDGGALFAYQSNFAEIELDASEFDDYLRLEGLLGPLAQRARLGARSGPGRERYARCPKTWVTGHSAERLLEPVGMPLEIVALEDPEHAVALRLRVLFNGRPLAGTLVRAWHRPLERGATPFDAASRDSVGPTGEQRTDRNGVVTLPIDRPGEWLVSTVHMVRCRERKAADWESLWASLTFARGASPR